MISLSPGRSCFYELHSTCGFPNLTLEIKSNTTGLDIAVVMYDMTGYAIDRPTLSYPLQDNETWTSVDIYGRPSKLKVLRLAMDDKNDGSVKNCGVNRTMLITVSNL